VIADEQQEGVVSAEFRRAVDGVRVPERLGLLDKGQPARVRGRGGAVCPGVPGADDHADLLDAGAKNLLDNDRQRSLCDAIAIDEGLEGERALVLSSGGDEGLANFHDEEWRVAKAGSAVNGNAGKRIQGVSHRRRDGWRGDKLYGPKLFGVIEIIHRWIIEGGESALLEGASIPLSAGALISLSGLFPPRMSLRVFLALRRARNGREYDRRG
jgi:hypothetical protein